MLQKSHFLQHYTYSIRIPSARLYRHRHMYPTIICSLVNVCSLRKKRAVNYFAHFLPACAIKLCAMELHWSRAKRACAASTESFCLLERDGIRCNSFFDAYKECIPKYYSVYSPYTVWNGMERCLAQCKSRGPFIFIRLMFM